MEKKLAKKVVSVLMVLAILVCGMSFSKSVSASIFFQKRMITIDANGGLIENSAGKQCESIVIKTYDSRLYLDSEYVPVKDGYNFIGWKYSADTSKIYETGDTIKVSKSSATLRAIWEKVVVAPSVEEPTEDASEPVEDVIGEETIEDEEVPL